MHEFTATQQSKESELDRFRKRFDIKDEYIRLQLLEKANTLPDLLNTFVEELKALAPALEFYTSFTSHVKATQKYAPLTVSITFCM